jgi:hypothetical protein
MVVSNLAKGKQGAVRDEAAKCVLSVRQARLTETYATGVHGGCQHGPSVRRPSAVRASPGGAAHSLSRTGFKVGRRPSTKGVDFSIPRKSDAPPLTQSTMREAFQRRGLTAISEDNVDEDREDETRR